MTALDVSALRRHIGTRIVDEDVATEAPLGAIVATFDREEDAPREGEAIPPGWHIGYFLSTARTATLAADGLPAGTGVLPKLPLPRRMYAGTRITFHAPLRVGDRLRRETELTDLQVREGGTGTLIVTTQTRRISTSRGLAITEDAVCSPSDKKVTVRSPGTPAAGLEAVNSTFSIPARAAANCEPSRGRRTP